jgi:hypothetical protein
MLLGAVLLLSPSIGSAQPPEVDDGRVELVTVETLALEPTVVKTGDIITQPYRVRFPDLVSEGQEIIILEDRMTPALLPVSPFEGVSLTVEKSQVGGEHIWDFIYGFRLVDPDKMTYVLPSFPFYYLIRDLGEDIEDAEVRPVDGGQGLVRYVSSITDEPLLDIRDTIELGSFAGRATFFRILAWTVAPLPLLLWFVMLVRVAKKPKAISLEKAAEEEELARIEAKIPIAPSIWEARRQVTRELKAMEDLLPGADPERLVTFECGLVHALRDYLHADLPELAPGDTALDIQRHVQTLEEGPRKEALGVLAGRLVAYQRGLELDAAERIENPTEEARLLADALSMLRPHVQLLSRLKTVVGR